MTQLNHTCKNQTDFELPKSAIVFLSTPRCGTQWLAKNLRTFYEDEAEVRHEPNGNKYHLRSHLGYDGKDWNAEEQKMLTAHFDKIEKIVGDKSYVEIGWQSISIIKDLYRRFGNRLKLVHLYRNPVKVAASMVTHNWYTGKVKERSLHSELIPFDPPAILTEYQDQWENMNLFEKALYYWTEINLGALQIKHRYVDIPFYSLKFESLFGVEKQISRITLIELLAFMGLDYDADMQEALKNRYDEYRYRATVSINGKDIHKHPQIIHLANKLGYRFDEDVDLNRYKKRSLLHKIMRFIKIKDQRRGIDNQLVTNQ